MLLFVWFDLGHAIGPWCVVKTFFSDITRRNEKYDVYSACHCARGKYLVLAGMRRWPIQCRRHAFCRFSACALYRQHYIDEVPVIHLSLRIVNIFAASQGYPFLSRVRSPREIKGIMWHSMHETPIHKRYTMLKNLVFMSIFQFVLRLCSEIKTKFNTA